MFQSETMRHDAENLVIMNIIYGVISLSMMAYGAYILTDLNSQNVVIEDIQEYPDLIFIGYLSMLIYGAQKAIQSVGSKVCYKVGVVPSSYHPVHKLLTLPIFPTVALTMFSIIVLGKNLDIVFVGGLLSAIASAYVVNKWFKSYFLNQYEPSYLADQKAFDDDLAGVQRIETCAAIEDLVSLLKNEYRSALDSTFDDLLEHVEKRANESTISVRELREIKKYLTDVKLGIDARRSLSKLKNMGEA